MPSPLNMLNTLRYRVWNILTSGLHHKNDIDSLRKFVLTNIIILSASLALLILSTQSFLKGHIYIGIVDLIFFIFVFNMFFLLRQTKAYRHIALTGTLAAGIFFSYLIITGSGSGMAIFWTLTYPLITILLMGLLWGTLLSSLILAVAIGVFLWGNKLSFVFVYDNELILSFIPVYISIYLFAFTKEKTRKIVQQRLLGSNLKLASANKEKEVLIKKLKQAMHKVQVISTIDPLTSLFNRRYFESEATKEIARAMRYDQPLSTIMVDIDHFKRINDTYGHTCGDHVLAVVADICKKNLRTSDLHGRYGGEEFIFLLPGTTTKGAYQLAERLRCAVDNLKITRNNKTLNITASFGIYERRGDETELKDFFDRSDEALYTAKKTGRNRVVIWQPKTEQDLEKTIKIG
ncbi:MAG: GGDEF domain-containing protein [Desulfobacteraceae bacterium]|nr:GGDEF domain-containing protein [Desulfobacteraceae bacterium]